MYLSKKYSSYMVLFLDFAAFLAIYPGATVLSLLISCFILTSEEKKSSSQILTRNILFHIPLLSVLFLILLPFLIFGYFIRFILTFLETDCKKLIYLNMERDDEKNYNFANSCSKKIYQIVSSNVLLSHEAIGKFNNQIFVYDRLFRIIRAFVNQRNTEINTFENFENVSDSSNAKDLSVLDFCPKLDFICFQEVWDRFFALMLIWGLRKKYKHFIFNVGDSSFSKNFCFIGSGLMVASKFPILESDFHPFKIRKDYANYMTMGLLMVKVKLSEDSVQSKVGFIYNTHTQAYQGKDPILVAQLDEICSYIERFEKANTLATDKVVFSIICGDFNFDNISPGDKGTATHPFFKTFTDPCVKESGVSDKSWAIGTEMRQQTNFDPRLSTPQSFKEILICDTERRKFIIDADVEEHTYDLMYVMPKVKNGVVSPVSHGGMRRIDKILFKSLNDFQPIGFAFLSILNQLTDHVPIALSFEG